MIGDDIVKQADKIIEKKFSFAGSPERQFNGDIDWHHSLISEDSWPQNLHWSKIPYKKYAHLGDIKACWDMNRHQFFITLGLAWQKTGDEKYAETFVNFLTSWINQNPPETGIHYVSNLEIGLRCVSWIFAFRLFEKETKHFDDSIRADMHDMLYAQAKHLARNLAYTKRTGQNNHLIGDCACLAFIAMNYPLWTESEKWLTRALNALWPALDEQILPDGIHFEGSAGYQIFVVELVLLVTAGMRRRKGPVPAKAYLLLEKTATTLLSLKQPDGTLPNINDNDDGLAIPYPATPQQRLKGFFAAMAVLYKRPDFKYHAQGWNAYAHMLLGNEDADSFRFIVEYTPSCPPAQIFSHGGVAVLCAGKTWALFKNTPDPFPKSGHNHADLLHFMLTLNGVPILVDAGTYRYNAAGEYRNALRGTSAHNAVCVDGKGQARPNRNFGWQEKTKAGSIDSIVEKDWTLLRGWHFSYEDIGIETSRSILWMKDKNIWMIADSFQQTAEHRFDQYWHFDSMAEVTAEDKNIFSLSMNRKKAALITLLDMQGQDETHLLKGDVLFAFQSKSYGRIEPAPVLQRSWVADVSCRRHTLIHAPDTSPSAQEVSDIKKIIDQFGATLTP